MIYSIHFMKKNRKWLFGSKRALNICLNILNIFSITNICFVSKNRRSSIRLARIIPIFHFFTKSDIPDLAWWKNVSLDSTLSGKYHCETLRPKLSRVCGMLSKARHYVPKNEWFHFTMQSLGPIYRMVAKFGHKILNLTIISLLRTITFSDFNS